MCGWGVLKENFLPDLSLLWISSVPVSVAVAKSGFA